MPVEEFGGGPVSPSWDAEQRKNAALIVKIGQQLGMSRRDTLIALITAAQESSLRNLNHGDRDSLGLFQQRPSQGWGSREQVTDPVYATKKFFTELKKVQGRNNMRLTEAAQAVQRSAYPDAYAKYVGSMRDMLRRYSKPGLITPSEARGGGTQPAPGQRPPRATSQTFGSLDFGTPGDSILDLDEPRMVGGSAQDALGATTDTQVGAPGLGSPLAGVPQANQLTSLAPYDSPESYADAAGVGMGFQKGVDGWRKGVVEYARQFVGTPYVWGGTSPDGFDCSGLLQYVFKDFGINLPRVSFQQANYGKRVSWQKAKPGDLIGWDNSSRNNGADHVALYLGNGRILEAARPGTNVRIRKLDPNDPDDAAAWGVRINK